MEEQCSSRWSDLPIEILRLIVNRLLGLDERFIFGIICKGWRSARALLPPSPLMLVSPEHPNGNLTRICLISLFDKTLYPLPLPEADGCRFCGSFDDWLVVAHRDRGNFLFNPFSFTSNYFIPLPHQATIKSNHREWRRSPTFIRKAILSSSPTSSDSNIVLAALHNSHSLSICRPRGRRWDSLPSQPDFSFDDIIFYNGILHAVGTNGEVYIVQQITTSTVKKLKILPYKNYHLDYTMLKSIYLVESRGRLLMVLRFWRLKNKMRNQYQFRTTRFKVLELQSGTTTPHPRWVEVKRLGGGHALFIGISCSKSIPATTQYGVQEDCIYFTDDHFHGFQMVLTNTCLDSGIFSMEDSQITRIIHPKSCSNSSSSPPLWLHLTYAY